MMLERAEWTEARNLLFSLAKPTSAERLPLWDCAGRVLARDLTAGADVPSFDRSPYDGYAFRAEDARNASAEHPVTLRVLEEVAAGATPTRRVMPGTAVKVLTGAPIPQGADAVVMYEQTAFTEETVTLFSPSESGRNIVRAGEDVRKGDLLAPRGTRVDAGLAGSLAAQGIAYPEVFRRPVAGILATGDEVADAGAPLRDGQIYNANLYILKLLLEKAGFAAKDLGRAGDRVETIAEKLEQGLRTCDAVITTGGVSAGDYDLTPDAMQKAGVRLLVRGVRMKPGMACAYGVRDDKWVCALSGNPASAAINFSAVAAPALRRIAGLRDARQALFPVTLADGFPKRSPTTRFLHGVLDLTDGTARMRLNPRQGNAVISSLVGCDLLAVVPAGSGPLSAGTRLDAFML